MADSPPSPPDEPSSLHRSKRRHGGARKKLTWQEKLALVDKQVVQDFILQHAGTCTCKGIERIMALGEAGIQMVVNLRDARMTGVFVLHT